MILRRSLWRVCLVISVFLLLLWGLYEYSRPPGSHTLPFDRLPLNKLPFNIGKPSDTSSTDIDPSRIESTLPSHPIDQLITHANTVYNTLRAGEKQDERAAAAAYRKRRGRHPPPDFGHWVAFAKENNALLIEELFDRIYDDLEPFWAIDPKILQKSVAYLEYVVSIRGGTIKTTESHDGHAGIGVWKEMFMELKEHLPDVDIAFNVMDEPRLLVPWDIIKGYKETADRKARLNTNGSFPAVTKFSHLAAYESQYYDHHWISSGNYWVLARDTCPVDSPARRAEAISDFMTPPEFPSMWPYGSHKGYVANWTTAKDPCSHPHLRGMHGTFIAPNKVKTSKDLFPIFGSSKLSMNNDILLPPPEYWTAADPEKPGKKHWWEQLGVKSDDWNKKEDVAFWRGPATGGRNRRETWTRFQRHRLLSMMNSTHVAAAQSDGFPPRNFPLPDGRRRYKYYAAHESSLSGWIKRIADGKFTDLVCYEKLPNSTACPYNSQYYEVAEEEGMWKHFANKYLPDVDGDAFSTDYYSFLGSSSLPIKATIYNEWHDSRLVPWKHFVPMDNTFVDFWAIMDYFLGGRDAKAKAIAEDGRKWAATVLRREDMLVYIYRLVLEYARIMDERREKMGFVDDLRKP